MYAIRINQQNHQSSLHDQYDLIAHNYAPSLGVVIVVLYKRTANIVIPVKSRKSGHIIL